MLRQRTVATVSNFALVVLAIRAGKVFENEFFLGRESSLIRN